MPRIPPPKKDSFLTSSVSYFVIIFSGGVNTGRQREFGEISNPNEILYLANDAISGFSTFSWGFINVFTKSHRGHLPIFAK